MANQNPEQIARDKIDGLLTESGWIVQSKKKLNLAAGPGVAVTEYRTDSGPVDYLLFIDKKPIGVIEAKKAEERRRTRSPHRDDFDLNPFNANGGLGKM
jgi:type I restriction enzyme, R subunit